MWMPPERLWGFEGADWAEERFGFNAPTGPGQAPGAGEERREFGEERIKHRLTQEHRLKPVLLLKFDETLSAVYGV